jgi:antitoxin FitA
MASMTIRNIDETIKTALRVRAARHGVSMEEEARRILRDTLSSAGGSKPLGQLLMRRFHRVACEEFALPERHLPRTPPAWDDRP